MNYKLKTLGALNDDDLAQQITEFEKSNTIASKHFSVTTYVVSKPAKILGQPPETLLQLLPAVVLEYNEKLVLSS